MNHHDGGSCDGVGLGDSAVKSRGVLHSLGKMGIIGWRGLGIMCGNTKVHYMTIILMCFLM